MREYNTAERFYQLCSLAKHSKRCMICLCSIVSKPTGRPRVTCRKKTCKVEYQSLYFQNVTKPARHELATQVRTSKRAARSERGYNYREGGLDTPGLSVVPDFNLDDFFSTEADSSSTPG